MIFPILLCSVLVASVTRADEYHNFGGGHKKAGVKDLITRDEAENKFGPEEEKDSSFWIEKAQGVLGKRAKSEPNTNKAKNLILFMGDGMSIPTLAATRVYKGQLKGKKTGEEEQLSFEKFPFSGLSKTYCSNGQVADSACTATAYLSGVKANIATIGVNAHVQFDDCEASANKAHHVESIIAWAQKAGMSTGLVTTTRVTHASPAGVYAHTANRDWESDTDVVDEGSDPKVCQDIASQLINNQPGNKLNVILGGGREKFEADKRVDGVDLISKWKKDHPKGRYVVNLKELLSVNPKTTPYLLGLFQPSHLDYHLKADENQPTLTEMTEAAIKVMKSNPKGFVLFVEGGRIDTAHHETRAKLALDETLEFSKAIKKAHSMTNPDDTQIVVTSDHSHAMTLNGYPERGNDILGLNEAGVDANGVPYTVLSYAVGAEQYLDASGARRNVRRLINEDFQYPSMIRDPHGYGHHAGDDVGIFASGPYAHMFSGVMEQNLIPHIMAYSACIGPGLTRCNENNNHNHHHHGHHSSKPCVGKSPDCYKKWKKDQ